MVKGVRGRSRRGTALILYTVLLPALLLFCGLAIDLTVLYVVQARLSSAVDGAALGAGRLLGSSADASEIAGEFISANFPIGYWGSTNLVPSVSRTDTASVHTINVSATVQVPLLFLRLLRQQSCSISATSTAVRQDVRLELVLDRSASMSSQMSTLRTAAGNFVSMFNPGSDELGLVAFGGSAFVAYPNPGSTPSANYTGGAGPDIHFADAVSGGSDNLFTVISSLYKGSDTNTSEALWLAYLELKKAVAVDTDPTRANIIVLFTDGVPNGFTAYLNDPSHNALKSGNCYYNPSTGSSNRMIGWIATSGSNSGLAFFDPNNSDGTGVYSPLILDTSHTAKYWATSSSANDMGSSKQLSGSNAMLNCNNIGSSGLSGLAKIPSQDYYGNSTSGTAYTQGVLFNKYNVTYDNTQPNNGYHLGLASWNVTDNVAQRILSDSSMNIAIYTIGFTGNGGVDAPLLKRIANTQDATSYNSHYQSGLYVEAKDSQSLSQAFMQVASEVLRLTK